jgi:hypothetical protein
MRANNYGISTLKMLQMTSRFNTERIKMNDYGYPCAIKLETSLFILLLEIVLKIFDQTGMLQFTEELEYI